MSVLLIPASILTAVVHLAAATPAAPTAVNSGVERQPRVPTTFGSSDIRDWYAPDNETIVISTYSHGKFKGRFMNRCQGVRFAESLGFATPGPYELDAGTTIVLPDGRRCGLRELLPYSAEEERREREGRRKK